MPDQELTNFKSKYPAYKDIPDSTLLQAIRTKYPMYNNIDDSTFVSLLEEKFAPKRSVFTAIKESGVVRGAATILSNISKIKTPGLLTPEKVREWGESIRTDRPPTLEEQQRQAKVKEILAKPLISISEHINPKELADLLMPRSPITGGKIPIKPLETALEVGIGAIKGGVQVLESLSTPTNIALLAGTMGASGIWQRIISLGFSGHMTKGLVEQLPEIKKQFTKAVEDKKWGDATAISVNVLGQAGFAVGAAKHGLRPKRKAPAVQKVEAKPTAPVEKAAAKIPEAKIAETADKIKVKVKSIPMSKAAAEKSRGFLGRKLVSYPDHPPSLAKRGKAEAILSKTGDGNIEIAKQDIRFARASWEKNYGGRRLNPDMEAAILDAELTLSEITGVKPIKPKQATPIEETVEKIPEAKPVENAEKILASKPKKTQEKVAEAQKMIQEPTEGNLDKIADYQAQLDLVESGTVWIPGSRRKFIQEQLSKLRAETNQELGIIYKPRPILPKAAVEYTDILLERAAIQKSAKRIIRKNTGALEQKKEVEYNRRKESLKFWDYKTRNKKFIRDFILKSEAGNVSEIARKYGSQMGRKAEEFRQRLEAAYDMTKDDFTTYIENYWPHIWKNPKKATQFMGSYFKKIGKPNFSKKRSIELFEEGLEYGLKPRTWNPEEMVQMREVAAWQWLTSKNIVNNLRQEKLLGFYRPQNLPEGWQFIDHPAFKRRHVIEKKGEKPTVLELQAASPEPAAKVINNWLSPSLWSRQDKAGTAFRVAMRVKNPLVAIKLGLSAFHAVEITGSAVANQMNVAARAASFSLRGIKDFAVELSKAPAAFFSGAIKGGQLKKAYKTGTENLPPGDWKVGAIEMVRRAGGRPDMTRQELFDSVETMKRAWRQGKFGKAIAKSPLAGIESVMAPLMKMYVPNIKMYSFFKLAEREMMKFNLKNPEANRRAMDRKLQEVWDNIDNRFGQVVYDNIFWNRTVKDALIGSSLSLGWNLGVFREFGGAYWDVGKAVTLGLAGKNGNLFSNRVIYSLTYPIVMGTIGTLVGKLLTGEDPKEVKDIFYPKTGFKNSDGSDERLMVPTQMKEYFAWNEALRKRGLIKGTATVLSHKAAPVWSMAFEMIGNEDYFGTKITDAKTGTWQWAKDYSEFMINFLEPISVSGFQRTQSETARKYGLSFAGFNPAPRYVTRTMTQKRIYDAYEGMWGATTKTKEEGARIKIKTDIRNKIRKGTATREDFIEGAKQGVLKKNSMKRFIENSLIDGDLRMFANLSSERQSDILSQMNADEIKRYIWYANNDAKINYIIWKKNNP